MNAIRRVLYVVLFVSVVSLMDLGCVVFQRKENVYHYDPANPPAELKRYRAKKAKSTKKSSAHKSETSTSVSIMGIPVKKHSSD